MSESLEHQDYVRMIVEYSKAVIPADCLGLLRADLPEYTKPTLAYDSYIPDVMYSYKGLMIIGEAKTYNDFKREHSIKQYDAYFKECMNYPGQAQLVIAVPWELSITAKNHFKKRKRKYNVDFLVSIISSDGRIESV